jgi:hypothetical protein
MLDASLVVAQRILILPHDDALLGNHMRLTSSI